ncbi:MAG: hypothetical protein B7Z55_05660 [Planctomycetales bacterium 12-60-4]|nr:MAG: hypothetical protein B7Z55_05660 [Planctomycetales bacterium 12-60-4]
MNYWIRLLGGDSRFNLWGWTAVGYGMLCVSGLLVVIGIVDSSDEERLVLLLLAIYVVLLGHFGLALTNYCARLIAIHYPDDHDVARIRDESAQLALKPPAESPSAHHIEDYR